MRWRSRVGVDLVRTFSPDSIHMVRKYPNRLAIWRKDGNRLTWEELQKIKCLVWGDDIVAVEVYPCNDDVVNIKHTRHLWTSTEIREAVKKCCRHPEFEVNNESDS